LQHRAAGVAERPHGAGAGFVIGEDRGDAAQRADPVHGDRAELARVGQDVGGGRVRDDRAPGGHLGRVVVGQPGLRVHATGAEERLVGVEVGEERLGLRAIAGRVAVPDLPAAQQQVDLFPVGERHRGRHRVRQHPAAEGLRQRPGHLQRGGADVDDDRVPGLDQGRGQPRDGQLPLGVQGAPGGEVALGGPDRQRAAVDPLEQPPVPQPAQVAADRLQRHAEPPREFLGGDRLGLAELGEDGLAALSRQHTAPE
jgi:hypothetical protein